MTRPRIALLTMGGTIASLGARADATSIYEQDAARDPVRDAAPLLADAADVTVETFAHLPSHDVPLALVLDLARRIAALRSEGRVQGVVVSHGTDTLEETAYLLDLLLPAGSPVVVTGAARPASALSADGPLNLLNAVKVAAHADAAMRGVLVCLNERISMARSVTKAHTSAVDAFRDPEQGHVGSITGTQIAFHHPPSAGERLLFDAGQTGPLPSVEIIPCHLGVGPLLFECALAQRPAGVVIAGTGNGSVPEVLKPSLARARGDGVIVVRASRTGSGAVTLGKIDTEHGTIPAGCLNPHKARLLLMLALRQTRDRDEIAGLFSRA